MNTKYTPEYVIKYGIVPLILIIGIIKILKLGDRHIRTEYKVILFAIVTVIVTAMFNRIKRIFNKPAKGE